jgi:hypothetical protein
MVLESGVRTYHAVIFQSLTDRDALQRTKGIVFGNQCQIRKQSAFLLLAASGWKLTGEKASIASQKFIYCDAQARKIIDYNTKVHYYDVTSESTLRDVNLLKNTQNTTCRKVVLKPAQTIARSSS